MEVEERSVVGPDGLLQRSVLRDSRKGRKCKTLGLGTSRADKDVRNFMKLLAISVSVLVSRFFIRLFPS